jgi:hypothetical protein
LLVGFKTPRWLPDWQLLGNVAGYTWCGRHPLCQLHDIG